MKYPIRLFTTLLLLLSLCCTNSIFSIEDKTRTITLPDYKTSLPSFEQFDINGVQSGCVPSAFAMATAYWYLHHGFKELYSSAPPIFMDSKDLSPSVLEEVNSIREYIKTDKDGKTTAFNSLLFKKYLVAKGFKGVKERLLITADWNALTWRTICDNTESGKPVILLYTRLDGSLHAGVVSQIIANQKSNGWLEKITLYIYTGANYYDNSPGIDIITSGDGHISTAIIFSMRNGL